MEVEACFCCASAAAAAVEEALASLLLRSGFSGELLVPAAPAAPFFVGLTLRRSAPRRHSSPLCDGESAALLGDVFPLAAVAD